MNIYVINPALDICGIIDDYVSIIWTTRYYKSGDFELYVSANEQNVSLLKEKYYLCREEDIDGDVWNNVMIIENINITTDVEAGNYLIITGKSLKSIVGRRIIWQQTNLYGSVELGIRQVLTENIISPTIEARKIADFELEEIQGFDDTMNLQVTGDNIEEWLEEVCMTYGIGWDVYINNKKFVFHLWKGTDRSYNQDSVPYVVFSKDFDNLLTSDFSLDKSEFRNTALVAGEGEGLDRKTYAIGNYSGLDRYELYVDARDISSNNGEINDAEYNNMLNEKGNEALAEHMTTVNFEGEVDPSTNYIFNKDYFLGDIVEVINEYGITSTPRITEIIDSEDDTGRTIIPNYSAWEVQ